MTELVNRLADELSPYLRMHSANPVAWQPWDERALAYAREHDLPIFLSIGYATCHWCHVMERESFADAQTAAMLNQNFVCIKVDREERPDIDKTYQAAHYLLARMAGGWPLSVMLAHDLTPFYSGTYFPPTARGGMPAFQAILERVAAVWQDQRAEVEKQSKALRRGLEMLDLSSGAQNGNVAPREAVDTAVDQLASTFDAQHGGLGKAPKFPQVPTLSFLLEQVAPKPASNALAQLRKTLDAMAAGGLHDHIDAGFFRYCVDPVWDIPHFEKMLYDNAQLLELYAVAAVALQEERYAQIAKRTAAWLLGPMRTEQGGLLTAIDADADGHEGASYVWTIEQLAAAVDADQMQLLKKHFDLGSVPNFGSAYHLRCVRSTQWQQPQPDLAAAIETLLAVRAKRPQPAVDDKVLAVSCGLGALALARAGCVLEQQSWLDASRAALVFAANELSPDGRMRVAWRAGRCSKAAACLDDYASVSLAWLELFKASAAKQDLDNACSCVAAMIDQFDDGSGGLRFVSRHQKEVLRVLRSADDGPQPSGNGMAALVLLQLGWLLGDSKMLDLTDRILGSFASMIGESGAHCPTLMRALALLHDKPAQAAVFGPQDETVQWTRQLRAINPFMTVYPVGQRCDLPGMLRQEDPASHTHAMLCTAGSCSLPISSLDQLIERVSESKS